MTEKDIYDVIIIGGGPAGLTAAQYASRAQLRTVVLDKSPSAGALAYSSRIENYPGLPEPVTGGQLLTIFREQAVRFGAEYVETKALGVNFDGEIKEVFTQERSYHGKAVIIATGSMGRLASIEGESRLLGKGVSYCATCDGAFFKGETVCVVGDNDEAAKEAETLTRFASKVYFLMPSNTMNIPDDHPVLALPNLEVMKGERVTAIEGTDTVEKVRIRDIESGEEKEIRASGVFIYLHGNKPVVDFLMPAVSVGPDSCIDANRMMETSIPGVYSAGDVSCTEVRQVVIAAANGCVAALSAEMYVRNRKHRKYDWAKGKEH